MSSQHYLFVWLCLVVVIITSPAGVDCRNRKKPARKGTLNAADTFREVKKKISTFVETVTGRKYLGRLYLGRNEEYYESFADIPYAKPPVGKLRFKKPQSLAPSDEVIDVSKSIEYDEIETRCKQVVRWEADGDNFEDRIDGDEDCLYLDIIRPAGLEAEHHLRLQEDLLGESKNADVLVFLHPGTFMYDISVNHYQITEYFCCNFMLFVFVRFRLGPLGFANLSPFTEQIGTNLGLWDQVAALSWIQQNINAFRGDAQKVTLVGVAAGAASVNYHMLSEASKGLFSKAISVGGSALCPWAMAKASVNSTLRWIDDLSQVNKNNCSLQDKESYVPCLMNTPADTLMKQSTQYIYYNLPMNTFAPIVDDDFLEAEPEILMRVKQIQPIPWLISFSSDNALYPNQGFVDYLIQDFHNDKWLQLAPILLDLDSRVDPDIMNHVTRLIRKQYDPSGNEHQNNTFTRDQFMKMMSDRMYTSGIVEAARLHARALTSKRDPLGPKVFLYNFLYKFSRFPAVAFLTSQLQDWNVFHQEEFASITKDLEASETTPEESIAEQSLRKTLVILWSSFIKDGKPYHFANQSSYIVLPEVTFDNQLNNIMNVAYSQISMTSPYANVTLEPKVCANLGQLPFWQSLPIQIYEELQDIGGIDPTLDEDDV